MCIMSDALGGGQPFTEYLNAELASATHGAHICGHGWDKPGSFAYFKDGSLTVKGQLLAAQTIQVRHCLYIENSKSPDVWVACSFRVRPILQTDCAPDSGACNVCAWAVSGRNSIQDPTLVPCNGNDMKHHEQQDVCGQVVTLAGLTKIENKPYCGDLDGSCARGEQELRNALDEAAGNYSSQLGSSAFHSTMPLLRLSSQTQIEDSTSEDWWWFWECVFFYIPLPALLAIISLRRGVDKFLLEAREQLDDPDESTFYVAIA